MTALPSGSCALVWDSETEARTKPHGRTASRSCRNPWEGNLNQSWSQEVAWSRDNPLCLLINRPWCLVSCKSDLFQIPSRVFSLLIHCLRYAFETWFGKIGNAPGQLIRWPKTTEPGWPRACDLYQGKHRTEKPVHCNYRVAPARWQYRSPEKQ